MIRYAWYIKRNECQKWNKRYGLDMPCKIRFYGDHKREQMEKYKVINSSKMNYSILLI